MHTLPVMDESSLIAAGIFMVFGLGILLVIYLLTGIGLWKMFVKADEPGIAGLIPFWNVFVMVKLAGKPQWWAIFITAGGLMGTLGSLISIIPLIGLISIVLVPLSFLMAPVSMVLFLLICLGLAEVYGQGAGFGIGMFFLGFIFFPILGFGDAEYQGAKDEGGEEAGGEEAGGEEAGEPDATA